MAFDLSNLTKYVDQVSGRLIHQILLEGVTAKYVTVQPTVKYSESINLLSNTLFLQDGTCGWNTSGTTTLTQRNITVCPLKVNQNFCLYGSNSIEQYWTGMMMKAGSGANGGTLPFEEVFTDYLAKQTQQEVEKLIWKGSYNPAGTVYSADTAGGSQSCTGFLKVLTDASATTVNIAYAGVISASNAITIVDAIVAAIPADIIAQEDIIIFASPAVVQFYKLAIRNANAYHYFVEDANDVNSITQRVPGYGRIKMVGTVGLTGTNRLVCSYASNFYIGTDLVSEIDPAVFKVFYAVEADELRYLSRLKVGVQVAFPQHIVVY